MRDVRGMASLRSSAGSPQVNFSYFPNRIGIGQSSCPGTFHVLARAFVQVLALVQVLTRLWPGMPDKC